MDKRIRVLVLLLIGAAITATQTRASESCVLDAAKNGQTVAVDGKVVQEPHDLAFEVTGCVERVILAYAGDSETHVRADRLRVDKRLKQFQKYTSAVYRGDKNNTCMQCARYTDVEATLSGVLDIAVISTGTTKDTMGFLHDESGRVVGTSGFGHPTRMFKYQLVVLSVLNVRARKLPQPKQPT
jgi:hypothetical protein